MRTSFVGVGGEVLPGQGVAPDRLPWPKSGGRASTGGEAPQISQRMTHPVSWARLRQQLGLVGFASRLPPALIEVKAMAADRPSMIAVMEDVVVATPLLRAQTAEGEVRLVAAGAWTAPNAAELERLVAGLTSASTMARAASIDMRAIEQLDTYGALLLDRLSRRSQARVVALARKYQGLLGEVQGADIAATAVAKRQNWMIGALESLGRSVWTKAEDRWRW